MVIAIPGEDETFLSKAALKYVKPEIWEKEKFR